MWKILKQIVIFSYLVCPIYACANEGGTTQIKSIKLVTDQGGVLSMNAPDGKLIDIVFCSHADKWSITPDGINLHGGSLALHAFKLGYDELTDKNGARHLDIFLIIPVIFSTKKNNDISYDEGKLKIDFIAGGDASVELWREQFSDRAMERVRVKRVK